MSNAGDDDTAPPVVSAPTMNGSSIATVQTYDGTTDVRAWLRHVRQMADAFSWSDETATAVAKARLIGNAAIWLEGERLTGHEYSTLQPNVDDSLYEALQSAYAAESNQERAMRAMQDLHQKHQENVVDFHARICVALNDINYMVDDKTSDAYKQQMQHQILLYFTAGLQDRIKRLLMNAADPPDSAELALQGAQRIERELGLGMKAQPNLPLKTPHALTAVDAQDAPATEIESVEKTQGNETASSTTNTQNSKKDNNSLQQQMAALTKEIAAMKFNPRRNNKKGDRCFFCNGVGHWADRCPRKLQRQGGGFRPPQNRRGRGMPRQGRNRFNNRRGQQFFPQQVNGIGYDEYPQNYNPYFTYPGNEWGG